MKCSHCGIALSATLCLVAWTTAQLSAAEPQQPLLLDYTEVLSKIHEGSDLTDQLMDRTRSLQLIRQKKMEAIDRLSQDLKATEKDSLEHQAIEEKLDRQKADLAAWTNEQRANAVRDQSENLLRVWKKIEEAAGEIATLHAIKVIEPPGMPKLPKDVGKTNLQSLRALLLARQLRRPADAPDITGEVIALLDSRYAAVRPATKPTTVYLGNLGNLSDKERTPRAVVMSPAAQSPALSPLKDAVIARIAKLSHNLSVKFTQQEKFDHDPAFSGGGQVKLASGQLATLRPSEDKSSEGALYALNSMVRWECRYTPEYANIKETISVYTGDHVERYDEISTRKSGFIQSKTPVATSLMEVALGVRRKEDTKWLQKDVGPWFSPDEIRAMTEGIDDAGNPVLQMEDSKRMAMHRWTFRTDWDYTLIRYQVITRKGWLFEDVDLDDFRKVGDFRLPFAVHERTIRPHDGVVMEDQSVTVTAMSLDEPENTVKRFAIQWPEGTDVRDMRPAPQRSNP